MIEWPWKILNPNEERWWLAGVAVAGGQSVAGSMSLAKLDGGGLWMGEQSFLLHCPDQIRAARALEAQMDGGVEEVIAWSHEDPFSPGAGYPGVPHSDGTPFSDTSLYAGGGFSLTVRSPASLRSTALTVLSGTDNLRGGERFSIVHPRMGTRRYQIGSVVGDKVTFRPPLREALQGGETMDFGRVGCVSRLANPNEFMGALRLNGHVPVVAQWVESFNAARKG